MQVTAEHPDPCTVVLDINVDEQRVTRAFEITYKEFGRYANVPGFRPGKAPRAIVQRYVNAEKVRQQALEKIIRESYLEAIQSEAITPYRDPHIETTDLEDKKPYFYKAVVPLEPQVTLGDYTNLAVDKPVYKVTETLLENRLNALREERARLERVADRGVQAGDILIVEQQVKVEGDESDPGLPRRQLVQLGNNVPGYDEAILGMEIGEERTFELTYPEDFEEANKQGKQATFTIKLSSISAKKIPELNDEFAQFIQAGETVEEMREGLRARLQAEADQYSEQVAEQRLFDQILENSSIHFPSVLVREEVEEELRRLAQELRQTSVSYAQYLQNLGGLTPEQHQVGIAQQAALQIRTLLALREISIQEDLQATDAQVDAEFERLLSANTITDEQYAEYHADQRRRLQVANALIQQRLHDFLFAHNTINPVEQAIMPTEEEMASEMKSEMASEQDNGLMGDAQEPRTLTSEGQSESELEVGSEVGSETMPEQTEASADASAAFAAGGEAGTVESLHGSDALQTPDLSSEPQAADTTETTAAQDTAKTE